MTQMSFSDWLFSRNSTKLEFSEYLYSARHIAILVVTIACAIGFSLLLSKRSPKTKRIVLFVIGGVLLFFEIAVRIFKLATRELSTFKSVYTALLPVEFCSVVVWIFIISCFVPKWKFLLNFSVIGGTIATIVFLLFPAVGLNKSYIGFMEFYSIFTHAFAFVGCMVVLSMNICTFKWSDAWKTCTVWLVIGAYACFINYILFPVSNYMYLTNNPLPFSLPFPHQIALVILVFGSTAAFYGINSLRLFIQGKHATKVT